MTFLAEVKDLEVRKVEEDVFTIGDKEYKSLKVHFDDPDCNRIVLKDKDVSRKDSYHRGDVGTVTLRITIEQVAKENKAGNGYVSDKTTIQIEKFEVPTKEKKK
jgi:hypothetical protein